MPTQARVKHTSACTRQLTVTVPPDDVRRAVDRVMRRLQQMAQIPGFRKGKAPLDLVEHKHGAAARREATTELVEEHLHQALREAELRVVGEVRVADVSMREATGLTFQATVEVEPAFKLGGYVKLALRSQPVAVSDAEVETALEDLRRRQASASDEAARGRDPGDARTPRADPAADEQIREAELPPLDEAFAKRLGLDALDALRDRVRAELVRNAERRVQADLERQLFDQLLQRTTFDVPASLVAKQQEQLKRDAVLRLMFQGLNDVQIQERLPELEQDITKDAEHRVRLFFIINRVAETEQICVTPEELAERLRQLARQWGKSTEDVRAYLEERRLYARVEAELRHEKTVAWLLDRATVTEQRRA